MPTYLIQLTPHDTFFFGTGKEFGTDNQNYYVQSGYFPQQTSLLGMLRYQLLCQADASIFKNNKIQDREEAGKLIGNRSFRQGQNNDFGVIKSLSPLFLIKNNRNLYPLSKEFQKENGEWVMREISPDFSLLEGYNAKIGLPDLWTDGEDVYTINNIFETVDQIGIRKNYDGKSDDKAFYQQTYRKLKDGISFAFYAEIESELKDSALVVLGGEQKTFSMKVKKQDEENNLNYQPSKNAHKIILLSGAYIDKDTLNICDFAITNTVEFRCLQANIRDTNKYYNLRKEKEKKEDYKKHNLHKSVKIELYERGSVFYFSNDEDMETFADNLSQSEFYAIGYNHYKTVKKQ